VGKFSALKGFNWKIIQGFNAAVQGVTYNMDLNQNIEDTKHITTTTTTTTTTCSIYLMTN
jgi:hypothetical protein